MKTRSQSAMEYLMTYGWAILIIAVILGVLFSLGVFNPTNYAPKVPAGNCHVFRPNGPGTSFNVNLVGTCSGFLPQYVAHFNGQDSKITTGVTGIPLTPNTISISLWINVIGTGSSDPFQQGTSGTYGYFFEVSGAGQIFFGQQNYGSGQISVSSAVSRNQWYHLVGTKSGNTLSLYINGVQHTASGKSFSPSTATSQLIGDGYDWYFKGSIANVQIYNASLDANEVQYLYNEGIGGAPIYLSHLVAWWPLNGDVKDYSGNGNHGTPTNISFNGSWTTGYSQP